MDVGVGGTSCHPEVAGVGKQVLRSSMVREEHEAAFSLLPPKISAPAESPCACDAV